jgi:ribosomal protein S12 methylthiotransferase accessory factor
MDDASARASRDGSPARVVRRGSSLRACAPALTLSRARVAMSALGITRVTDITRLDQLGLPVFTSIRPRGQGLRVHAGKGLRAIDAQVGALMEAIEFAVADPHCQPILGRRFSAASLQRRWGERLIDLVPLLSWQPQADQRLRCLPLDDLSAGHRVWVPSALVFYPWDGPSFGEPEVFGATTTGLASGNTLDEATLHGLLEVLERDAIALHHAQDRSMHVAPDELPAPFRQLALQWRALGIHLAVRCIPNDFELPCFFAVLHDATGAPVHLAGGHGIHLDARVALSRAVCEAAQSRLSQIHGGRDDVTRYYTQFAALPKQDRSAAIARQLEPWFDAQRRIRFRDVPSRAVAGRSLAQHVSDLVAELGQRGFPVVARHRFNAGLEGLEVVRIVIPRCEDLAGGTRRAGMRFVARVIGRG